MINYVEMTVSGKKALVPVEKAKMVAKKQEIVAAVRAIQNKGSDMSTADENRINDLVSKIIRLNRRIGPCVRFI